MRTRDKRQATEGSPMTDTKTLEARIEAGGIYQPEDLLTHAEHDQAAQLWQQFSDDTSQYVRRLKWSWRRFTREGSETLRRCVLDSEYYAQRASTERAKASGAIFYSEMRALSARNKGGE